MMKKTKLYVVPHAHWDKEWYFTKQEADVLLQINLQKLLKIFETNLDYKSFVYDGQSSIIDDFVDYGGDIKKLNKIIKAKKLIIGPWYTQPDLFNTTSEGIVRNLLIGTRMAKLAGHCMQVAYVPDSFGQPEQMPQIYKHFNLTNMIYWRGIKHVDLKNSVIHFWEGIDGTKIKSINFLLGYWVMGSHFPYLKLNESNVKLQAEAFLKKSKNDLNKIISFNDKSGNKILLPLGGDQAPINEFIPQFIDELNKLDLKNEWIFSDYDKYFDEIKEIKNIPIVTGELKFPQASRIHKTIGSQRYDIKKYLKMNDKLLFDQLEPLLVFYKHCGGGQYSEIINSALKKVLVSSAHDSLGGCCSDPVNADVLSRLKNANDIFESLKTYILKNLSQNLKENDILIFNPLPKETFANLELTLFTKEKNFVLFFKDKKLEYLIQKQKFIHDDIDINVGTFGETTAGKDGYYKTKIITSGINLSGLSIEEIKINSNQENIFKSSDYENKFWKVSANEDGTFNIFNKKLNREFKNQYRLKSQTDAGDSYDYSPSTEENLITSKIIDNNISCETTESLMQIISKQTFEVEDKKNQEIILSLKFLDSNKVMIRVNMNNENVGIRWTIDFDSNFKNEYSYASQAFSNVKRSVKIIECENWKENGWPEKPHPLETNESYVYLKNEKTKFGVLTLGTNEYEIIGKNNSTIAITLFRSVDCLGKNNLLWRPGRASGTGDFVIKTKGSEMKGSLEFDLVHIIDESEKSFWAYAQENLSSPLWLQKQILNKYHHRFERFLLINEKINQAKAKKLFEINNENIIAKAIKISENKREIILRVFNPTLIIQNFNLQGRYKIFKETNCLEEVKKTPNFNLKPHEIKTYILRESENENE